MIKHCVICGAAFSAPPSSKKVTCSRECSARRKADTHRGKRFAWPLESRIAKSKALLAAGYTPAIKAALAIANALPDGQRGPQHRDSKRWVLIDPEGRTYRITDLLDWARRNADAFDIVVDDADRERIAANIRAGFGNIAQTMLGHRKHPIYTYKGWRLGCLPEDKIKED